MNFSAINTPQSCWLLLDASALCTIVGIVRGDGVLLAKYRGEKGALSDLPEGIADVFAQSGLNWEAVSGFLYGQGPGSALGLRLAAMMIRTWKTLPLLREKPVFSWRSLPFLLAALAPGKSALAVSVARKGQWDTYGTHIGWQTYNTASLPSLKAERILFWPQRKLWESPPAHFERIADNPVLEYPRVLLEGNLLSYDENPDGFAVRPADYTAWTAPRT